MEISKIHVIIKRVQLDSSSYKVLLIDKSKNGVYVNGQKVDKEVFIKNYDLVTFLDPSKSSSIQYIFVIVRVEQEEAAQGGIQNDYMFVGYCGKGTFSSVWKIRNREKQFALKLVDKCALSYDPKLLNDVMNEVNILRMIKHPNIIELHYVAITQRYVYMVEEMFVIIHH